MEHNSTSPSQGDLFGVLSGDSNHGALLWIGIALAVCCAVAVPAFIVSMLCLRSRGYCRCFFVSMDKEKSTLARSPSHLELSPATMSNPSSPYCSPRQYIPQPAEAINRVEPGRNNDDDDDDFELDDPCL